MLRSDLNFFFVMDPAPTEIYTLSLHDALPISVSARCEFPSGTMLMKHLLLEEFQKCPFRRMKLRTAISHELFRRREIVFHRDRKSTRLNSSHTVISYAVFCLKKKRYNLVQCSK